MWKDFTSILPQLFLPSQLSAAVPCLHFEYSNKNNASSLCPEQTSTATTNKIKYCQKQSSQRYSLHSVQTPHKYCIMPQVAYCFSFINAKDCSLQLCIPSDESLWQHFPEQCCSFPCSHNVVLVALHLANLNDVVTGSLGKQVSLA